jgi:flap endonuclease-1
VAFVFDGKPPEEKRSTINDRSAIRDNAQANWEEALSAGQDGFKYAIGATKVNEEIISDAKRLLSDMGIPVVFAPSEGEAQAAYIASRGDADYVASQDYDSVLFGAPVVIRNLAISGRRKLPKKNIYVDVSPETITLKEELDRLGISRKQLVEIGVLCGTDYNEGISRIGPKTALKLIKEHGDIESVLKARKESADTIRFLQLVRELFMHPNVSDEYDLRPGRPKPDRIISFLCQERDFSVDRVTKAVERLESASKAGQSTLDRWF